MTNEAVRVDRASAPLRGRLRVPGSKSLSTRAIILAAIAGGPVLLRDVLVADDTEKLLAAVNAMGARMSRVLGADWRIDGRPLRDDARNAEVDLGDGGAPTRFAMALAALRMGNTRVDGSARMRERPIADGVRLLRSLGVQIDGIGADGALPVRVHGRAGASTSASAQKGIPELEITRTASSQFVTAIMLIAPALPCGVRLRFTETPTSASYLALTIETLTAFGVRTEIEGPGRERSPRAAFMAPAPGTVLTVHPGMHAPPSFEIPADASSAVVWVAAAAMIPGSRIELEGVVRDAQPDLLAIDAIGRMGAALEWRDDALVVESGSLRGVDLDAGAWPDGALAVAAAASAARGPTRLRSLATLRVKESDRLAAIQREFGRLGVCVRIEGDDLVIEPTRHEDAGLAGATGTSSSMPAPEMVEVDTHHDHRMAMCLTLIALRRGGVMVNDPECVAKSYPGFWRHLAMLAPTDRAAV